MKYPLLKAYLNHYTKNRINIVRYWMKNKEILNILKNHEISAEVFVKNYALDIINYHLNVIEGTKEVGECDSMKELILFFKEKDITLSELFIICSGLKSALLEITYDFKITNLQIEKEINHIYENSFLILIDEYSKKYNHFEDELIKKSNIVDKYVIMSRTDLKGIITDVSKAFCEISGYSEDELIGKPHNIIRHPDMLSNIYAELWDTIKAGKAWSGELKNLKKDGGFYWVEAVVSPIFDSDNNIIAYEAIRQDITHQKELEEQQNILVEQSKSAAMGEMISMIAHQWRQPLQAVSILIQKLSLTKMIEGEITDELLEQVVDSVGNQLNYMSKTIDDFRDFFLPDKPKELVEIESVINRATEFVSFMFKNDSIVLNIDVKTNKKIVVHINELVQVLINLFKNARDIMVEKRLEEKNINISVYEKDACINIEIEDNAGGIPENIIKKVFDPYFSTKSDKNGTGLGLYMCKTIIEKHSGGKLSVENSEKGAVFKISLPIN